MADALASGASVRKDVGVQVPPRAPLERFLYTKGMPQWYLNGWMLEIKATNRGNDFCNRNTWDVFLFKHA